MINLFLFVIGQVPMADTFRSEGKIYVVIAVILLLLAGIFYYLMRLDGRVKKMEKELKDKK